MSESRDRWRAMTLLAVAELLGMSLWFGVSAVAPAVAREWNLSPAEATWLTVAVQLGFVAGTLINAFTNLPDIMSPRLLFVIAAIAGAGVNALIPLASGGATSAITLRFLTGVCLAGVYPPGMKIVATWFRSGRGLALGILVGALTFGKASPYLVNALGSSEWERNVLMLSVLAIVAAMIVFFFVEEGPFSYGRAPFNLAAATELFRNRPLRLANIGYFGHMWELYAMWTWLPVMLRASAELRGTTTAIADIASFVIIATGALGCIVAGALADRVGRTVVTSVAMAVSGSCCVLVGLTFDSSVALLVVAAIWGATVVADSAQFSACITELSDPRYVGTALTMQTCVGFLLTTVSIQIMPPIVELVGWRLAFIVLAPGPFIGTLAMLRLRALPESRKLAGGQR